MRERAAHEKKVIYYFHFHPHLLPLSPSGGLQISPTRHRGVSSEVFLPPPSPGLWSGQTPPVEMLPQARERQPHEPHYRTSPWRLGARDASAYQPRRPSPPLRGYLLKTRHVLLGVSAPPPARLPFGLGRVIRTGEKFVRASNIFVLWSEPTCVCEEEEVEEEEEEG
ncbi:hypothetical protein AOLI_G00219630 [Acnodon oligacanthus]